MVVVVVVVVVEEEVVVVVVVGYLRWAATSVAGGDSPFAATGRSAEEIPRCSPRPSKGPGAPITRRPQTRTEMPRSPAMASASESLAHVKAGAVCRACARV